MSRGYKKYDKECINIKKMPTICNLNAQKPKVSGMLEMLLHFKQVAVFNVGIFKFGKDSSVTLMLRNQRFLAY